MAKFVSKVWRQFCGKHARTLFRRQTTLDSKIWTRTLLTAVSNKSHGGVLRMKLPAAALMSSNGDTTSNRVLFHTDNTLFLPRANADNLTAENLIEAWFNEVKPFGTLCVHDFPFDVHVQPLNPVDYPDANKSLVKVFYDAEDKEPLEGSKLSKLGNLCDMKVLVEEDGERVEVTCDIPSGVELPLVCVINVPINFGKCWLPVPPVKWSVTLAYITSTIIQRAVFEGDHKKLFRILDLFAFSHLVSSVP